MTNDVLIARIRDLIRMLQITQNEFADRIKTDRSNFSKHVNGKLPINDSLINKIVVGLGVSKDWLLTGQGKVFYMTPAQHSKAVSLPASAIQPNVRHGAKVYDVDVTAGSMGRSMMFSNDRLIGAIDVPFISPDSCIVRVSGDSMQPVICCGDMIAIREVRNLDLIFWGQIYVVLLDDYRMVKYIRKHEDPSMVILRSANKEYDDIEVRKSDIRDLFVVEHIIRFDSRM